MCHCFHICYISSGDMENMNELTKNTYIDHKNHLAKYFYQSIVEINDIRRANDSDNFKFQLYKVEELVVTMKGDPIFDEYKICTEFSESLLISHYNIWFGAIDYEIKQIFFKKYSEFIIERTIILLVLCVILIVIGMYIV